MEAGGVVHIQRIIPILLSVAVFGLTQSCFTIGEIGPKRIKGTNIDVKIEEKKIIIKVQTRYKPETYIGQKVTLVNLVYRALEHSRFSTF